MTRQVRIMGLAIGGVAVSLMLPWALSADGPAKGGGEVVRLPEPKTTGGMALTEALAKRRSHKAFANKRLTSEQIAQLCWSAQGITEPSRNLRTAPAAFALYCVTVYVVDEKGMSMYVPESRTLRRVARGDMLARLRAAEKGQVAIASAPASMVLTMDVSRLQARSGAHAERYCLLEVGHVAQNVLLQATALGLVSRPVGGINEENVAVALDLPKPQRPVYVLPLGYPQAE